MRTEISPLFAIRTLPNTYGPPPHPEYDHNDPSSLIPRGTGCPSNPASRHRLRPGGRAPGHLPPRTPPRPPPPRPPHRPRPPPPAPRRRVGLGLSPLQSLQRRHDGRGLLRGWGHLYAGLGRMRHAASVRIRGTIANSSSRTRMESSPTSPTTPVRP